MGDSGEYRFLADAGLGGVSSVVSSLPAGYTLGEARVVDGIKYKLVYNAGTAQATVGAVMAPVTSAGPYSVSISHVSKAHAHIGACMVKHATITTGAYGWAAVKGRVGNLISGVSSVPTGSAAYIAGGGQVNLMPQSVVTGNTPIAINLGGSASATATTGTASGDFVVSFSEI